MRLDSFNTIIQLIYGRMSKAHSIDVDVDDLVEFKDGIKYLKDGSCRGTIKTRAAFLKTMWPMAIAKGSWQMRGPEPFLLVEVPDAESGDTYHLLMEEVHFHIPKKLLAAALKGGSDSPQILEFSFEVTGQVFYGLGAAIAPIFKKRNKPGID